MQSVEITRGEAVQQARGRRGSRGAARRTSTAVPAAAACDAKRRASRATRREADYAPVLGGGRVAAGERAGRVGCLGS